MFAKPVGSLANLLLLAVVGAVLVREHQSLAAIPFRGWCGMLVLMSASLAIGWLCGGPRGATRTALAITTSVRNVAVALLIVTANFASTPAVTAVVAYALVSISATLGIALIIGARQE
jgi:predicted Na+-dependent transporter